MNVDDGPDSLGESDGDDKSQKQPIVMTKPPPQQQPKVSSYFSTSVPRKPESEKQTQKPTPAVIVAESPMKPIATVSRSNGVSPSKVKTVSATKTPKRAQCYSQRRDVHP